MSCGLAGRRGLAGPIGAHVHEHGRRGLSVRQRALQGLKQIGDSLRQQTTNGSGLGCLGLLGSALQADQQVLSGGNPCISLQKSGLQVFVQRIVDARAGEDGGDAGAGLAQPGLEFVQPALAGGRGSRGGRRRCSRYRRRSLRGNLGGWRGWCGRRCGRWCWRWFRVAGLAPRRCPPAAGGFCRGGGGCGRGSRCNRGWRGSGCCNRCDRNCWCSDWGGCIGGCRAGARDHGSDSLELFLDETEHFGT